SPMAKQPDIVISLPIDRLDQWEDEEKLSSFVDHNDTKWRLRAKWVSHGPKPHEMMQLQLECLSELTDDWNVEAECILPNANKVKIVRKELKAVFGPDASISDFGHLITYTALTRAGAHYVTNNRVTIEARVHFNNGGDTGEPVVLHDFSAPLEDVVHVVLRIGEKRLYVAKDVLAVHSPVFRAMFYRDFRDKNQAEIEIKEIVYE
ncbi:hypothetical protein PFISCL1PPCAC_28585, partial [Pristionchus fissidentatus]